MNDDDKSCEIEVLSMFEREMAGDASFPHEDAWLAQGVPPGLARLNVRRAEAAAARAARAARSEGA